MLKISFTQPPEEINLEKEKTKMVIIPSAESLIKMKKEIMKIKGIDLTKVMHKMGKSAGNDIFEYCIKDVEGKKNKIKRIFEVLNSTDYGKYELKEISKNEIIVRLTQSPFTDLCSEDKKPSCHWMSGLLTALFNNINKSWSFEINKCKNLGHSCCEFKGKIE